MKKDPTHQPADGEAVEVKTPRKALEAHAGGLAAKTRDLLTAAYLADVAAAAGKAVPAPERAAALLERLAVEFSPEAFLALCDGVAGETAKKAGRDLSINEVETVLSAHLGFESVRDLVAKRAETLLAEGEPAPASAAPEGEDPAKKAAEYLDLARRVQAEFDNYRKRSQREMESFRSFATTSLVEKLLPVLDALDSAGADPGVAKIRKLLFGVLAKEGLEELVAVGQPFDPAFHEAILQEESAAVTEETVIEEMRKGYRLGERVVRPTMVKVATPAGAAPAAGSDQGEGA